MSKITTRLGDNLRTISRVESVGADVQTDATKTWGGLGELPSPGDLVGVALGACILTVAAVAAQKGGFDFSSATISVEQEFSSGAKARITTIRVLASLPASVPADARPAIERALHTCPVGNSLLAEIDKTLDVEWV